MSHRFVRDDDAYAQASLRATLAEVRQLENWAAEGDEAAGSRFVRLAMFKGRLGSDIAFYQAAWRRIVGDRSFSSRVQGLVADFAHESKAGKVRPKERNPRAWGGARPAPGTGPRTQQRMRREEFAHLFRAERAEADEREVEFYSVFNLERPALPDIPPQMVRMYAAVPSAALPERFMFPLIQIVPETWQVSRAINEAWAKAFGRTADDNRGIPRNPAEEYAHQIVGVVLNSTILPQAWFLKLDEKAQVALLQEQPRLVISRPEISNLRTALSSHGYRDDELVRVVDDAAWCFLELTRFQECERLLDCSEPILANEPLWGRTMHARTILAADQGQHKLAMKHAQAYRAWGLRAGDLHAVFTAGLCHFSASRRLGLAAQATIDSEVHDLLVQARELQPPPLRAACLRNLCVELDKAGKTLPAERALLAAVEAGEGLPDVAQTNQEFSSMRDHVLAAGGWR